jgi:hypothetical protein
MVEVSPTPVAVTPSGPIGGSVPCAFDANWLLTVAMLVLFEI